jgi:hypothetical protein
VARTQRGFIHPATHDTSSSTDPSLPPMGLRLRLNIGFDTSGFRGQARIVLDELKRHGMIVADNGSNWYITGARHPQALRTHDSSILRNHRRIGSLYGAH